MSESRTDESKDRDTYENTRGVPIVKADQSIVPQDNTICVGEYIVFINQGNMTISINFQWIIDKLQERAKSVPEEIIEILHQLDREQGKNHG